MNLRSLDLNLLIVFDAIYGTHSISKAARKLHLSQPTVSNALARLRERLGDPLFERSATGMLPTARAKRLAEPIRRALVALEQGLRDDEGFDFASSDREFVIAVEDYGEAVILPTFIHWLADVAPGVRIRIRPESSAQLKTELRESAVDLALDYFPLPSPAYRNLCVLTETLSTLSRPGCLKSNEQLSLEQYLAMPHIVLAAASNARPMIDLALAKRGLERHIAVRVPHFISMPLMVQASNMLCTLPLRIARIYAKNFRLQSHSVPVRTPRFPVYLIWHEASDLDLGHQWFRESLQAICRRL